MSRNIKIYTPHPCWLENIRSEQGCASTAASLIPEPSDFIETVDSCEALSADRYFEWLGLCGMRVSCASSMLNHCLRRRSLSSNSSWNEKTSVDDKLRPIKITSWTHKKVRHCQNIDSCAVASINIVKDSKTTSKLSHHTPLFHCFPNSRLGWALVQLTNKNPYA